MSKNKNEVAIVVAPKDNEINRQLILNGPSDQSLLSGVTIQQTAEDISNMAVVDYITLVDGNLRIAIAEHAKAAKAKQEVDKEYTEVAAKVEPPEDFMADLRAAGEAISKFRPKCTVSVFKKARKNDDDDDVASDRKVWFSFPGLGTTSPKAIAFGRVFSREGGQILEVNRSFDIPNELVKAREAVELANAAVGKAAARIDELRAMKAQAPQIGRETAAAVTRFNLKKSGGGDLAKAITQSILARAKKDNLVVGADALAQLTAGGDE